MTMEAKIGHYFKRLTMIENTLRRHGLSIRRVTEGGGLCVPTHARSARSDVLERWAHGHRALRIRARTALAFETSQDE